MLPGQPLDLDHTDDRAAYRGYSHRQCNQRAGGKKGFLQGQTLTPGRPTFDHTSPGPVLA
jgi:hypothetical protein